MLHKLNSKTLSATCLQLERFQSIAEPPAVYNFLIISGKPL